MSRSLLSASAALSLVLLAGRVTGLLRELGLASVFGVGATADLAVLLLTLPDLLVNLLLAGGINAVLVPRFSALPQAHALGLFRRASALVFAGFSLAALALVVWPRVLLYPFAPGIDAGHVGAGTLAALALALPLTGVAGVAGAYLNAQQRYLLAGCGTLFFNGGVLAMLVAARGSDYPLALLGVGIGVGAAARLLAQLPALPRGAWRHGVAVPVVAPLARPFMQATVATALALLAPVVVRAMASTLGAGAIASFNYAQKLVELPVTILVTSICTVALAQLSALHGRGEQGAGAAAALRDTRYALLVGLTVLLFGTWFADAAVYAVFGHGMMDPPALARIARLAALAMLGVPFLAIGGMATAWLNARGQVGAVLRITAVALLLLPLLALPGLLLGSENMLMLAVAGFQAINSLWLARRAGLPLVGSGGALGALATPQFARVAILAASCVALDLLLAPSSQWLRLALAGAGFGAAMALPVRRFHHSNNAYASSAT